MNPPEKRQNTITRYRIAEENLVGHVTESIKNYDLMTAVMICLGKPGGENYNDTLKLLNVLLSDETKREEKRKILQDDFGIPMTQTLDKEVDLMCNLSKGVWEKGEKAGMEAGMEVGRKVGMEAGMKAGMEAGIKAGTENGILGSIRSLMETMKLSADQAMAALKVPESERSKYTRLLQD